MENFNKKAVSEVIEILNHTDKEIVEKMDLCQVFGHFF